MANDLEFRIGAEISELKAALAQAKKDIQSVTQATASSRGANPFKGITEGAKEASAATGRLRDSRGRFIGGGGGAGGGRSGGGPLDGFGRAGIAGAAAGAIAQVGRLAAGLLTVAGALKLIGEADELNTLNARLRLSTSSTEEFAFAQRALFDVAQRTRSGLGDTIRLYSQIAQATKDADIGQDVLLGVVETINKAVQLSGASAQAAEAALVQLGQGLASGTLRGEELNSILEQTPALADAIAKGMGITRGELRKFGQEGKIGAQQVIEALQKQREEVDRQFAQLPLTVGQSVTLLKNSSLQLLGAFDEASGSTRGLAETIKDLSEFLQSDEALGGITEFASIWTTSFGDIVKDVGDAVTLIEDATRDIMAALGVEQGGLVSLLIRAFKELPVNLRTVVRIVAVTFAGMADVILAQVEAVKEAFASLFNDDTFLAIVKRREAKVAAIRQAVQEQVDDILGERQRALDDAKQIGQGAVFARRAATDRGARDPNAKGKFKKAEDEKAAKEAEALRKASLDREERLLDDSVKRQTGLLETLYEDGRLAAQDYYRARESIELAAAERSIQRERERLAGTKSAAERQKVLADIEILERSKADIAQRIQREAARDAKALASELEQARAQDLDNAGQTAAAARIRLEAQFRDLLARLELAGDKAGANLIRKLIDTGVARAQFQELEAQFDKVLADLQARQAALADQQRSGAIGPAAANQSQTEARQKAAAELEVLAQKMRDLAKATNDPAIQEGAARATEAVRQIARDSVTGVQAAIEELRDSLAQMDRDFARLSTGAGVDALTGLFTDLASGTKEADDALRDFVVGFVRSMAEIAARAIATYLVLQALSAITGIPPSVLAGAGQVAANVKHTGGDAGQGTLRQVSPLAFIGAPRLHDGSGVLGIKPGEIPAILQQGEKVQSREEVAAEKNGNGNGATRIVNIWDPKDLVQAMSSSAGERVILNAIEKNKGAVRQKLA